MASLEELAQRYLVTEDGDTPGEPCGPTGICNYNDRVQWNSRVRAIRLAMARVIDANRGKVQFEQQTLAEAMRWMAKAFWVKKYPSMFEVKRTPKETAELAQEGVGVLKNMLDQVEAQGGTVPTVGPVIRTKDRGLPGNDLYWLAGAGAVVLLALLFWRLR